MSLSELGAPEFGSFEAVRIGHERNEVRSKSLLDAGDVLSVADFTVAGPTDEEIIDTLETSAGGPFPQRLRQFYRELGGISVAPEYSDYWIHLCSAQELFDGLMKRDRHYEKLYSLGLIDMIRYRWDNDRPEFDQLDQDLVETINNRYKGIGWKLGTYFYFDEAGRFGSVYYHQDYFGELVNECLLPMSEASPARFDFDALLEKIFIADDSEFGDDIE